MLLVLIMSASLLSCAGVRPSESEFEMGMSAFNRGKFTEAIPHFEKATEAGPDSAKAYLYLGRSYLGEGKWREALPPLRTAYRLDPEGMRKQLADILMDTLLLNPSALNEAAHSITDILQQRNTGQP